MWSFPGNVCKSFASMSCHVEAELAELGCCLHGTSAQLGSSPYIFPVRCDCSVRMRCSKERAEILLLTAMDLEQYLTNSSIRFLHYVVERKETCLGPSSDKTPNAMENFLPSPLSLCKIVQQVRTWHCENARMIDSDTMEHVRVLSSAVVLQHFVLR